MKKIFIIPVLAGSLFLTSCGGGDNNQTQQDKAAVETVNETPEVDLNSIPGIQDIEFTQSFVLEGNDQMKFDKKLVKVKAGEKVSLQFKNVGELPIESMGHNVVILKPNVDVNRFGNEAMKAKDNEYIPLTMKASIVAHTKLLGPGQEETIEFVLEEKGVYPFICSFPGHYGVMKGEIVAF